MVLKLTTSDSSDDLPRSPGSPASQRFLGNPGFTPDLPSGKHTKNYGKSPFSMGKYTTNGPFSIAMLVYQRVRPIEMTVKMMINPMM